MDEGTVGDSRQVPEDDDSSSNSEAEEQTQAQSLPNSVTSDGAPGAETQKWSRRVSVPHTSSFPHHITLFYTAIQQVDS